MTVQRFFFPEGNKNFNIVFPERHLVRYEVGGIMSIHIMGTGSYLPEKVMTNEDFEKIIVTSDEWITKRTGIKRRH